MNALPRPALAVLAGVVFAQASFAQSAHAARQSSGALLFHYGLVPAQVALGHPEGLTIAGQPSFGGFVSVGAPGIYRIRFDVRRPGSTAVASAEFEHRVSPEMRR